MRAPSTRRFGPTAQNVRASFLTILYALNGVRLDLTRDPYDVDGIPRDVVKAWIMVTLGHDKFPIRWPSQTIRDFRKSGLEISAEHPVRKVRDAVLAAHPILANWPTQSVTCFDLMFLESRAVVGTMVRLMGEHEVVGLSVHDSLILPKSKLDLGCETLRHQYKGAVGVFPALRVNFNDEQSIVCGTRKGCSGLSHQTVPPGAIL